MKARVLGPVAAIALAGAGAVVVARDAEDAPATSTTTAPAVEPVAVTSNAPRVATLGELVASADLVVRAEVTHTEHGRLFGDPGSGAVESRLVTLAVTAVLTGERQEDSPLVVEEEGWLEDGTPIAVDGAAPSAVGDEAIWFLDAVGTSDAPVYVVVSAQGRYLIDGDDLHGADGDDPLVDELAALTAHELTAAIAALPPA